MKTLRRSHLPEQVFTNGKTYVRLKDEQNPPTDAVRVLVMHPNLKGKRDIHEKPYEPSEWYFIPYESPDDKAKREAQEAIDKGHIEFWVKMFEPRTKKWCREKLSALKKGTCPTLKFETPDEPNRRWNQIEALKQILGK
jgi:hypothetical protein